MLAKKIKFKTKQMQISSGFAGYASNSTQNMKVKQ